MSESLENHEMQRKFLHAVYDDLAEAERLFKSDPQFLHYRSSVGETAFHYLVVEAEIERAARLLDWGADINTQDDFGGTPLMHAVMLGNLDLVKWLIARGASLEPKNVNDETALTLATSNVRAPIFQFLIAQPRKHPIDYYYDDLTADSIVTSNTVTSSDLVMKDYLISLGLTGRF